VTKSRGIMLAYLACAVIWGTTWFAIRISVGPGAFPPMLAAALRFTLATAVLAPLAWWSRPWPQRGQWPWLVLAGGLDALGYALIYAGEREVPGGLAAVVFGTQPVILTGLLLLTRLEAVRRVDIVSAVIALVGVAIIFADQVHVSAAQAVGMLMILGSVVVSTLYTMVIKRHAQQIHPLVSTTIFVGATAGFLWLAFGLSGEPLAPWPPTLGPTLALVYLAVAGTAIGFAAYFWLLSRISLVASNLLAFLLPIIALAVDALFESHVRLGGRAYLGVAVTLAAVALSRLWSPAPSSAP
jgi:drug/metabolite transporter (DMT)-like permease